MKIGNVELPSPFVIAPMAGMTDTAFRRLVKRHGGCGLVVSEMVSSEGLVRGIDRTLEYAEFTEEERPVSIQIFGGDPAKMAAAAQVVESMGADIVDVNMGCPVPKIAKHNAGCSLMREPAHAASVISAMTKAVKIPVTVKMRAGWNDQSRNALDLARRVADSGAAAVTIHGRTAEQSYSGFADWHLVEHIAAVLSIPVFGSGDLIEPEQIIEKLGPGALGDFPGATLGASPLRFRRSLGGDGSGTTGAIAGVLVGRGVLRNPWILAQAADLVAGRPPRAVSMATRGQFLLDYIALLVDERAGEADGFRHVAPVAGAVPEPSPARGRERWVINKVRALAAWYSKGFDNGSHFRTRVNTCQSIAELRDLVAEFFTDRVEPAAAPALASR